MAAIIGGIDFAQKIIGQILSIGKKIEANILNDKLRKKTQKFQNTINPITPPFYYRSLKERSKNLSPSHPYSVENIISNLNNDVIPVGYSLEQLSFIGFGEQVENFNKRSDKQKENLINQFKELTKKLVDVLDNEDDKKYLSSFVDKLSIDNTLEEQDRIYKIIIDFINRKQSSDEADKRIKNLQEIVSKNLFKQMNFISNQSQIINNKRILRELKSLNKLPENINPSIPLKTQQEMESSGFDSQLNISLPQLPTVQK